MQAFIVSMLGSEVQIPKPIFSFFLGAQELESLNINPNTSKAEALNPKTLKAEALNPKTLQATWKSLNTANKLPKKPSKTLKNPKNS